MRIVSRSIATTNSVGLPNREPTQIGLVIMRQRAHCIECEGPPDLHRSGRERKDVCLDSKSNKDHLGLFHISASKGSPSGRAGPSYPRAAAASFGALAALVETEPLRCGLCSDCRKHGHTAWQCRASTLTRAGPITAVLPTSVRHHPCSRRRRATHKLAWL